MALFRRTKKPAEPRCGAVVVAAGSSTRMGEDKILIPLEEEPVIVHTVRALELAPQITEIVVVTRQDLIVPVAQLCQDYGFEKVRKVVAGGASRLHSVRIGTLELSRDLELIAIHDGARPFVTQDVIEQVIRKAGECGAAAPRRASITAWVRTSASECPSSPRGWGTSTPPRIRRRPSTSRCTS